MRKLWLLTASCLALLAQNELAAEGTILDLSKPLAETPTEQFEVDSSIPDV